MSAALNRATDLLWHPYAEEGVAYSQRRAEVRDALAAALDVDEMAEAMVRAIHGDGWWDSPDPVADSIRENSRTRARGIRDAILGTEARR